MGGKVISLCLVLVFLISIAFAEPEMPTATLSADVTEGYAPLHVHFTSETTGDPTSFFWTFEPQTSGDWNSHHPESAVHTFQNPGVYDISLVVTNSAGSYTATEPHYITVLAPSTPAPTTTPTTTPTTADTPTQTPADTLADTPTTTPADIPTQKSTGQDEPSTKIPSDINIYLHCIKTSVSVGEETQSTLSVTNLNDKPIVYAQVILMPPSGTSVTSSEFVQSSGGQYEATYDINPGGSKNIGVNIKANQVGDFDIKGRVHYYFGDDKKDAEDYPLDLSIQASDSQSTPTHTPEHSLPDLGVGATVFILIMITIFKRK
jgi:PKD repeat protein